MQFKPNTPDSGPNGQGLDGAPRAGGSSTAVGEIRNFVADVEDLVKATTSLTGADLARAKARLVERVDAAKASLEKMGGAIADQARHTVEATDGYVHERPWQAIGMGAAAGLLVGYLLARRA